MAFEWREFLDVARLLQEDFESAHRCSQEASFRCAVSRAYYAAFGHARNFAVKWLGFREKTRLEDKSEEHGSLRALYRSKRRRFVSERLEALRNWRNLCDYSDELGDTAMAETLRTVLEDSAFIIDNLVAPRSNGKK